MVLPRHKVDLAGRWNMRRRRLIIIAIALMLAAGMLTSVPINSPSLPLSGSYSMELAKSSLLVRKANIATTLIPVPLICYGLSLLTVWCCVFSFFFTSREPKP